MRTLPLVPLLALLALAAAPAASAHTVYCDVADAACMAECLGTHAGHAPPHYCAVRTLDPSVETCAAPDVGVIVGLDGATVPVCLVEPVRVVDCYPYYGYSVRLFGEQVIFGCFA